VSTSTGLTAADNNVADSRRWSVPIVRSAVAFVARLDLFIVKDHADARAHRPQTHDHHGAKHETETAGQPHRPQHNTVV
jgi:hypothetical protein